MNNSDNIQVFLRVRPLNAREVSEDPKSCLHLDQNRLAVDLKDNKTEPKLFHFDWVAGESSTQQEIFEVIGKPMADTCLQGYNCCIFAYGQTGAGKTYTMQGRGLEFGTKDEIHCGLEPRILDHIFALKEQDEIQHPDVRYSIKCGYLEIYNEQIIDLFNPSQRSLNVREDSKEGVFIENLKEIRVSNSQEILKHLQLGARNRHVSSTNMNLESSRSHSLFIMTIQRKTSVATFTSKFNFVDLAGSERQKMTNATGVLLKEAGNINKSLSVLGKVINSLVETAEGRIRHTPYRDSKLTFILRDSLGGNSKTCLIANVSPAISSLQETLSTLKFAQRAKQIQNKALINENRSEIVEELQRTLERKDEELTEAKQKILSLEKQLSLKTCDCSQPTEYLQVNVEEIDQTLQYVKQHAESEKDQQFYENIQHVHALYSQREAASSPGHSENSTQRTSEQPMVNGQPMIQAECLKLKKEKRNLRKENESLKKENEALLKCLNAAPFITESCLWWKKGNQNLEKTSEVNVKLDQGMYQLQHIIQDLQAAAEMKMTSACPVCEAVEAGDMEVEENEEDGESFETEQNPIIKLRKMLKKHQKISEERGERLAEVEKKNQGLLESLEKLEAAKLVVDEKLAKMENKAQGIEELKIAKLTNENKLLEVEYKNKELTKALNDLKATKSNTMEKSQKDQDEMKNRNQELLTNLEELKAAKLITDGRLAQVQDDNQKLLKNLKEREEQLSKIENKSQELEEMKEAKLLTEQKLAQVEYKNRELLESLEELKATKLNDKEIMEKYNQNHLEKLSQKDLEIKNLTKEKFDLVEKFAQINLEVNNLTREKQEFTKNLSQKDLEVNNLTKEKQELLEKISQKDLQLNNLTKEKEELSQQLEQKSQELTSSIQSNRSKPQDASPSEKKTKDLEAKYKTAENQIKKIEAMLPNLNSQLLVIMSSIGAQKQFEVRPHYTINQTLDQFKKCFGTLDSKIKELLQKYNSNRLLLNQQKKQAERDQDSAAELNKSLQTLIQLLPKNGLEKQENHDGTKEKASQKKMEGLSPSIKKWIQRRGQTENWNLVQSCLTVSSAFREIQQELHIDLLEGFSLLRGFITVIEAELAAFSHMKAPEIKIQPLFSSSENKENNPVVKMPQPFSREGKVSGSTSASKIINTKRSFDCVGEGFNKENVSVKTSVEKSNWDFLDHDQPIIKKLKNN